jgi:hypothetical protein
MELASLCLAGIFWLGMFFSGNNGYLFSIILVLGVYLTTSDAQAADVECFSTDGSQTLLSDEVSDCQ